VTIEAPGGGGYGDPLERDPEMVETDVADGYVTIEAAKGEYGVVIDPATGRVDRGATEALRASRRGR
jgi:N-methylhydantoinase B